MSSRPPESAKDGIGYQIGDTIGPYKLLRVLGEGGMGTVYEAEQQEPVARRVALKVIKPGMDTKQIIARFEAERQALAVMDHPGIARVLDAGSTESGHPYFAMELVLGVPLIDYCDTHRLPTRKRLALFAKLCRAVQHAHQKGVIHRDLKPSNVLVTEHDDEPAPKVIDFGVAKAMGLQLTDRTLITVFGHALGTPAYMSPEQAGASGLDIDTRTDIYSLGVILYQLLINRLPFDDQEMAGQVFVFRLASRQTNPPTPSSRYQSLGDFRRPIADFRRTDPSTLHRELRGDLDWIVMKAMDPDRNRRYDTATSFALDIERYLTHETVLARPPSARYRLAKFVERNRLAASLTAVLTMAVFLGLVGTSIGFVRARKAEQAAAQEAATAESALSFMIGLFEAADPNARGGDTMSARELLARGVARIDSLEGEPLVQGRLLQAIGAVYTSLGLYDQADSLLRAALTVRRAAFGEGDLELELSLRQLAWLYNTEGRFVDALPLAQQSVAIAAQVYDADSPYNADALQVLGMIEGNLAMYDEARDHLERSLEIRENELGPDHVDTGWSIYHLAWLDKLTGNFDAAKAAYERLIPIHKAAFGSDHPFYAATLNDYAALLAVGPQALDSALALYNQVLAIRERALGPDHIAVASVLGNIGSTYLRQARPEEARPHLERAHRIAESVLGSDQPGLRLYLGNLANMYLRMSEYARAKPLLDRSLAIGERELGLDHPGLHGTLLNQGILAYFLGDLRNAEARLQRAAAIQERHDIDPDPARQVLYYLGRVALAEGRTTAVVQISLRAMSVEDRAPPARYLNRTSTLTLLAEALLLEGQLDSAASVVRRAEALERGRLEPSSHELAMVSWIAGRILQAQGRGAAADSRFDEALAHERALHGEQATHFIYDQAVLWTLRGDERRGLNLLREAVEQGYSEPVMAFDRRLQSLRETPDFRRLVEITRRRHRAAN